MIILNYLLLNLYLLILFFFKLLEKLERLMRKLEEKEILDHSNDSDVYLEMRKKDAIISHLLAQSMFFHYNLFYDFEKKCLQKKIYYTVLLLI